MAACLGASYHLLLALIYSEWKSVIWLEITSGVLPIQEVAHFRPNYNREITLEPEYRRRETFAYFLNLLVLYWL